MGEVVKLNCQTTLPIPPDDVLTGAVGKLDYVLVLGFEKFIHKLHAGDYG